MTTPKVQNDHEYIHDAKVVLDKINEGVLLLNELGSITFVNTNFQELVGYSQHDLEGLRFERLIEFLNTDLPVTEAKAKDYWRNIKNGSSMVLTLRIKHKEGYLIPLQLEMSARYHQSGEFRGAILIFSGLDFDLLSKVTKTINSSLKLEDVLANIVTVVVDYLGLTSTAVFLLDKNTDCLRLTCCNEYKDMSKVPNVEIPFGVGAPGMIAEGREPIYVRNLGETDLIKQTAHEPGVLDRFNNRSSIGYPLIYRDELLGVIAFDAANIREFSARERKIFSIISSHVAMAIYNAQLYADVERLSITDGLTGLYNHRYFDNRLQEEWIRATRSNINICLLVIDIDHFKKYNDQFGHLQGNKLLVELAELVKRNVRSFDVVCRFGGEEFTVILPECTLEDATIVAERIRKACEDFNFIIKQSQTLSKITISIGVASATKAKTAEELFIMADNALYDAKRQDRNKVIIA